MVLLKNGFTLSFDSWSTDGKTVDTHLEYQVEIVSAQSTISPQYLIVAHQTAATVGVRNKTNKIASFDNLILRNYHVDIEEVRYPRDSFRVDDASNDTLGQ